jgi:hypothetical protein
MSIKRIKKWLSARWAEPSTRRSVPVFVIAFVAIVYAIVKGEPSSAILAAGVMIYTALNSITPSP